jgi:hypothetical protein
MHKRLPGNRFSILLQLSCLAALLFSGCGQTAKPVIPPTAGQVDSYFGSPFNVVASSVPKSVAKFDHAMNQITVSSFVNTATAQVPAAIINGTFVAVPTGFLGITENFATGASGVISPQNPPLTGAWAVEIPGVGVLANLLTLNGGGATLTHAAPAAMAENIACPAVHAGQFLYVTVPNETTSNEPADYGAVSITSQGSAVTFMASPFLIGGSAGTPSVVTGGCSTTIFGPVTSFPLNSFGLPSNLELIAISQSGFLLSSFTAGSAGASLGAFGGGTGVIGVPLSTAPVDVSAVVAAKYNGFSYAPQTTAATSYDVTTLASAFGNNNGTSAACGALQSSLVANNGQGAGTVQGLPSANSLYGGEFLSGSGSGTVNDPTAANGSENCDIVLDLGTQDSSSPGLFPNAQIFVGSNFPPFSETKPWICFGTNLTCAVSFPASAVVGQLNGKFVIFVVSSSVSTPPAQLPDNLGSFITQPVGMYLFEK